MCLPKILMLQSTFVLSMAIKTIKYIDAGVTVLDTKRTNETIMGQVR